MTNTGYITFKPLTPQEKSAFYLARLVEKVFEHGSMEYDFYLSQYPPFDVPRCVMTQKMVNVNTGALAVKCWFRPAQIK